MGTSPSSFTAPGPPTLSFVAIKRLGTVQATAVLYAVPSCPPAGPVRPGARHVGVQTMPRGFLPAPLFATGARKRDWTVRCVYSACVTGVRAAPLLYLFFFLLFMLTLFNILCPVLLFFFPVLPIFFVLCYERSIIIHVVSWGGHKSHREEGLAPTLPPRELLFQTKAQRQSSPDEDFEKTRTYTYIINMYTCRHVCVVARI